MSLRRLEKDPLGVRYIDLAGDRRLTEKLEARCATHQRDARAPGRSIGLEHDPGPSRLGPEDLRQQRVSPFAALGRRVPIEYQRGPATL